MWSRRCAAYMTSPSLGVRSSSISIAINLPSANAVYGNEVGGWAMAWRAAELILQDTKTAELAK